MRSASTWTSSRATGTAGRWSCTSRRRRRAAWCGTAAAPRGRPASTKSAGNQRCAPSNSGHVAFDARERLAPGTRAADRRGRAGVGRPGSAGRRSRTPTRSGVASGSCRVARMPQAEVGVAERREQRRELGRWALQVGVEGGDERTARRREARRQRRRLPATSRKAHRAQPRIAGGEPAAGRRACRRCCRRRRRSAPRRGRSDRGRPAPRAAGDRGWALRRARGRRR